MCTKDRSSHIIEVQSEISTVKLLENNQNEKKTIDKGCKLEHLFFFDYNFVKISEIPNYLKIVLFPFI